MKEIEDQLDCFDNCKYSECENNGHDVKPLMGILCEKRAQLYKDQLNIVDMQEVFTVISNTDLTEGRGRPVVKSVCTLRATAERIAKSNYVQGGNCPIDTALAFKDRSGIWYVPGTIESATHVDVENQKQIDLKNKTLSKARGLGLTEDEIKVLQEL